MLPPQTDYLISSPDAPVQIPELEHLTQLITIFPVQAVLRAKPAHRILASLGTGWGQDHPGPIR